MSNSTTTASSSAGIGFTGLLTILFIALKLTGYISWPWVWVLSPLWITAAIGLALFMFIVAIALVGNR